MMLTMGENVVRALYETVIAAWNDHDGDAVAEPFAADGVVIGFDGSLSSGTQTSAPTCRTSSPSTKPDAMR
jgi:uncharacterized protein (TIGR02246 family)